MTFIITEACIDEKDASCVDVCPVDCIHEGEDQFYIDPIECVDRYACVPVCPVKAIYPEDEVPERYAAYIDSNYLYFGVTPPGRRTARGEAQDGHGPDHLPAFRRPGPRARELPPHRTYRRRRTIRAVSEIYDTGILRDVTYTVDRRWQPKDAAIRLWIQDEFVGSSWFRFDGRHAECEAFLADGGRISQQMLLDVPPSSFNPHPVQVDMWHFGLTAPVPDGYRPSRY